MPDFTTQRPNERARARALADHDGVPARAGRGDRPPARVLRLEWRSEHTRGQQRVDEFHGVLRASKRLSVAVRKSMTHNSDHLRTIPAVADGKVGNEAIRSVRRIDREVSQCSRNQRIARMLG